MGVFVSARGPASYGVDVLLFEKPGTDKTLFLKLLLEIDYENFFKRNMSSTKHSASRADHTSH